MLYCAFKISTWKEKVKVPMLCTTCQQCHNTLHFIQSVQYAAGVPSYSCNDQKKTPKMISGTNQLILIHTECHQNIRLE